MKKNEISKDLIEKIKRLKNMNSEVKQSMKKIAITGSENIKNELKKRGQVASVSHEIKNNKVVFEVQSKAEQVDLKNAPIKEVQKIKSLLGLVPLELFNQEVSENSLSEKALSSAAKQTQQDIEKQMDSILKTI